MCLYTVRGSTFHVFMLRAGDRLLDCWGLSVVGLLAAGLDDSPLNGTAGLVALTIGAFGTLDGSTPVVLANLEKFIYSISQTMLA